MSVSLKDKVVLVTGGAKNLGGAVSRGVAAHGARVAVHYHGDVSKADADDTVTAVRAAGGDAFSIQADLSRAAEVKRVFADTIDTFGSLYATVHTAGRFKAATLAATPEAEFDAMFAVNTKAAFLLMQRAAEHLDDGGKFVTLSSSLVLTSQPGYAAFTGSKAAAQQFAQAMAREMAPRRISVCTIAPGPMDTPLLWDGVSAAEEADLTALRRAGCFTAVTDIVSWVIKLLTDGSVATGQTFYLNNGIAIR
jgi:NAD(P)-dependent dehydrogenase (short-subunit alcohol dehydrogenase family)